MGDPPINREDFVLLCKELTAAFSEDYVEPSGLLHVKAKMVFSLACDKGMSKSDFRNTIKSFIVNQAYPNWTPGSFFKYEENEKLYPAKWMVEQLKKNKESEPFFEGYELHVEDRKIKLWRYANGQELPFKKIYPKPEPQMIIKPMIPDIDEDTLKEINMTKKLLKEKIKSDDYKRKLEDSERIIQVQKKIIAEMKQAQEIDPNEYAALKQMKQDSENIIMQLQGKIEKLRTWIIEQIRHKSTDEQLKIWNHIWKIIE